MRDLLEVLRVQRHDFMNHLQVISGLLQLKKYDRAGDYIKEVAEELNRAAVVMKLGSPGITGVILNATLAASKRDIVINSTIETTLGFGPGIEIAVTEIVGEMLSTAIHTAEVSPYVAGSIDFEIRERDGECCFQVSYHSRENPDSLALAASIVFMENMAAKVKGRLITGASAGGVTVISLVVPVHCKE
ncbi:MAG: sensor histidine kinase [Eubacteriales bacterium]